MKDKKAEVKSLSAECGKIREKLDALKVDFENASKKEDLAESNGEYIDEEQFQFIQRMKELKRKYKQNSESIRIIKSDIAGLDQSLKYVIFRVVSLYFGTHFIKNRPKQLF